MRLGQSEKQRRLSSHVRSVSICRQVIADSGHRNLYASFAMKSENSQFRQEVPTGPVADYLVFCSFQYSGSFPKTHEAAASEARRQSMKPIIHGTQTKEEWRAGVVTRMRISRADRLEGALHLRTMVRPGYGCLQAYPQGRGSAFGDKW